MIKFQYLFPLSILISIATVLLSSFGLSFGLLVIKALMTALAVTGFWAIGIVIWLCFELHSQSKQG
jgi:hypothetical protein